MVNWQKIYEWRPGERTQRQPLLFWAERIQDAVWVYPAADGWHGRQGAADELLTAADRQAFEPVAMLLSEEDVRRHREELPDVSENELAEIIRWEQENWFPDLVQPLLRKQCLQKENGRCLWEFAAVEADRLPQTVLLPTDVPRVYVTERDALAYALPEGTGTVVCAGVVPQCLYRYENYRCVGAELLSQEMTATELAEMYGGAGWYVHTFSPSVREEYSAAGASTFLPAVEWETTTEAMPIWREADYLAVAIGYAATRAALRWETGSARSATWQPNRRLLRTAAGVLLGGCVLAGLYTAGGWQDYMTAQEQYLAQEDVRSRLLRLQAAEREYLAQAAGKRQERARSTLLVLLADSAPASVTFHELQAEGDRVVLKGIFGDLAELQQWQGYLRQRLQTEVRLKYERDRGNGGTFLFNWQEAQDVGKAD